MRIPTDIKQNAIKQREMEERMKAIAEKSEQVTEACRNVSISETQGNVTITCNAALEQIAISCSDIDFATKRALEECLKRIILESQNKSMEIAVQMGLQGK